MGAFDWNPAKQTLDDYRFAGGNANANPGTPAIAADPYAEMYGPAGAMIGEMGLNFAKNAGVPQFSHIDERTGHSVYKVKDWANTMFDYPMGDGRVLNRDLVELHAKQDYLDKEEEIKKAKEAEAKRLAAIEAEKVALAEAAAIVPTVPLSNESDISQAVTGMRTNINTTQRLNDAHKPYKIDFWKTLQPDMTMKQDEKLLHQEMEKYLLWATTTNPNYAGQWGGTSGAGAYFTKDGVTNLKELELYEKNPMEYWKKYVNTK